MYSTADRLAQHVKQFPAMCRGWSSIDDGDARLKHALEETSKLCIGSPSAACFFFNAYSLAGMQALSALCIRSFDCFFKWDVLSSKDTRNATRFQRTFPEWGGEAASDLLISPVYLAQTHSSRVPEISSTDSTELQSFCMPSYDSFDAMCFLFWVSVWCVLQPPQGSSCRSTSSFASPHRSCLRKFVRTGTLDWLLRQLDLPKGNRSGSFQTCKKQTKQDIQGHIPTNKPSCPCPCHSFHESLLQRHGNGFSHFLSKWKSQNVDINLHFTDDENHFPLIDDLYWFAFWQDSKEKPWAKRHPLLVVVSKPENGRNFKNDLFLVQKLQVAFFHFFSINLSSQTTEGKFPSLWVTGIVSPTFSSLELFVHLLRVQYQG